MVTRVGKFVGGLGQDITNKANAHATENRIAFGASINPTANVHVVGTVLATTTVTATGGFLVPDDGDIGSASATDAIQISSAGIVTFKDDILIKDGGLDLIGDLSLDESDYKKATLNVNGHFTEIDQVDSEYSRNIDGWLEPGNNYVEIKPKTDIHIVELKVELE